MDTESVRLLRRVIIDVICICCAGFPILYFYLFGDPYKRGFFCDDESIRHPFHPSTITNVMLYCVGLLLPICVVSVAIHFAVLMSEVLVIHFIVYIVKAVAEASYKMVFVEYIHYQQEDRHLTRKFMDYSINSWIWRCYCVIGVFGFGAACSQFLTDVAKYTIGRLRPHFYDVCKPDIDCNLPENKYKYIEDFICMSSDQKLIREGRLSFVSGHSSFSSYTMIYLMLYLQARVTWRGSHLLKHLMQLFCFLLAWGTALSRISDYKHHWSDVLAGSLLGTSVALVVTLFVSSPNPMQEDEYVRAPTSLARVKDV